MKTHAYERSFKTKAKLPNNSLEPTSTAGGNGDSVWLRSCRTV